MRNVLTINFKQCKLVGFICFFHHQCFCSEALFTFRSVFCCNEFPAGLSEVLMSLAGPVHHLLLPCLSPASAMQVDVNGDAKRPPWRTSAQYHAQSYPSHLPECISSWETPLYLKVRCSAAKWSPHLCNKLECGDPDCSLSTGELPVVYQKLKGERNNIFHPLMCFYRNHRR